jgi:hypothetical protein
MFRILVSVLLLFRFSTVFSQTDTTYPRIQGDTLFTSSGYPIVKGQKVQLGKGTASGGTFEYITVSGMNWESLLNKDPEEVNYNKITRRLAQEQLKVVEVRQFRKKRKAPQYLIKLEYGFSKYWCDIENAIKSGEIILPKSLGK